MSRIWNPTEETVSTRIFGNHFEFKPGQFKIMKKEFAEFIERSRKEEGLVVLPPQFDPQDEENYVEGFEKTAEGKAILAAKRLEGISNLVAHYEQVVLNNQVALRKDLAHHDPHTDPIRLAAINASKGEMEAMRLVAKYSKMTKDNGDSKAKEVEKLMAEIGPIGR
jgi:quinol monooxygenase YgiN